MEIKNKIGIHNRFDVEVIDAKTGKVKQKAVGYNVICNNLWSRMLSRQLYNRYIHYGSGTGTPSASDTSLFHFVGYIEPQTANDVYTDKHADGYISLQRKVVLSETVAVGVTLTEVGIAYDTGANSLSTHALLRDMNGNPISIVKTNTDIVNIYATIYVHFSTSEHIWYSGLVSDWGRYQPSSILFGTMVFSNYLYNRIFASHGVTKTTIAGIDFGTAYTLDTALKKVTWGPFRFTADVGNANGIQMFMLSFTDSSSNTPPVSPRYTTMIVEAGGTEIPPTEIENESVAVGDGTTTKFATKFDCPYNATVYVNGVAKTTGVSIRKLPSISELGSYIVTLDDNSTDQNHCVISPSIPIDGSRWDGNGYHFPTIFYNPFYNDVGLTTITCGGNTGAYLKASNDLVTWTDISYGTLASDARNYKYYKFQPGSGAYTSSNTSRVSSGGLYDGKNIIFDTPPADGDVITISYTTDCVPKDAEHVFDLTITWQFGEYQEE